MGRQQSWIRLIMVLVSKNSTGVKVHGKVLKREIWELGRSILSFSVQRKEVDKGTKVQEYSQTS